MKEQHNRTKEELRKWNCHLCHRFESGSQAKTLGLFFSLLPFYPFSFIKIFKYLSTVLFFPWDLPFSFQFPAPVFSSSVTRCDTALTFLTLSFPCELHSSRVRDFCTLQFLFPIYSSYANSFQRFSFNMPIPMGQVVKR